MRKNEGLLLFSNIIQALDLEVRVVVCNLGSCGSFYSLYLLQGILGCNL